MSNERSAQELGFLLVGHGTRKATGTAQLKRVFEQWKPLLNTHAAAYCFLELAEPSIEKGVATLADQGVKRLVVVPLLLFTAGHAEVDIPQAVESAAKLHGVEIAAQTTSLGIDPAILELSAQRFRQAVCGVKATGSRKPDDNGGLPFDTKPPCTTECKATYCSGAFCQQTALAFVGRGSNSAAATSQMRRFSELRRNSTPVAWSQTCFLHGQSPSLGDALDALEAAPQPVAVIQPHLLFDGLLMDQLRDEIATRAAKQPERRWVLVETLGTDEALANALAKIALSAAAG